MEIKKMSEILNEQEQELVLSCLGISEEEFVEIHNFYKTRECKSFKDEFVSTNGCILKDKIMLKEKYSWKNSSLLYLYGMESLRAYVSDLIPCGKYNFAFRGFVMNSEYLEIVDNGICEDGDCDSIRYMNHNRGGIFKMRAGKFMRKILEDASVCLQTSTVNWYCEEFANEWTGFSSIHINDNLTLVVDDDFRSIYNKDLLIGEFRSCMSRTEEEFEEDKHRHYLFYEKVDAKAASLRDADGRIAARAIIFTDVIDEEGEKYRLCERQYSSEGDESLKRILVNRLITGGYIDGYKRIGAGCSEKRAFIANNGESLSHKRFKIECNLEDGDNMSYQDSFKNYSIDSHIADNFGGGEYDLSLTEGYFEAKRNFDEWNDEYTTADLVTVYYNGREYACAEDNLADFVFCENYDAYVYEDDAIFCESDREYHYKDKNVVYCESDGKYHLYDDDDIVCCYEDDLWYFEDDDYIVYCDGDDCEYHIKDNCVYCEQLGQWYHDVDNMYDDLSEKGYVLDENG